MARVQIKTRGAQLLPAWEQRPAWTVPGGDPAEGPALRTPYPAMGDAAALMRWAPHARAATLTQALLSSLRVSREGETLTISHTHFAHAAAASVPVVALTRPDEDAFVQQTRLVLDDAKVRDARFEEILSQTGVPWALWGAPVGLQPSRHPRTLELLGCALQMASAMYYRLKHEFACPRPAAYSPLVLPIIDTPGHGAFPSGHSTESFLVTRILRELVGEQPGSTVDLYLNKVAGGIARNREFAGVHFPVDSQAGRLLGATLAEYFIARATVGSQDWQTRSYLPPDPAVADRARFEEDAPLSAVTGGSGRFDAEPLLREMWKLARAEWSNA